MPNGTAVNVPGRMYHCIVREMYENKIPFCRYIIRIDTPIKDIQILLKSIPDLIITDRGIAVSFAYVISNEQHVIHLLKILFSDIKIEVVDLFDYKS